jgi:hypothetical protein
MFHPLIRDTSSLSERWPKGFLLGRILEVFGVTDSGYDEA